MSEVRSLLVAALGGAVLGSLFTWLYIRQGDSTETEKFVVRRRRASSAKEKIESTDLERGKSAKTLGCYSKEDVTANVIENDGDIEKEVPHVSLPPPPPPPPPSDIEVPSPRTISNVRKISNKDYQDQPHGVIKDIVTMNSISKTTSPKIDQCVRYGRENTIRKKMASRPGAKCAKEKTVKNSKKAATLEAIKHAALTRIEKRNEQKIFFSRAMASSETLEAHRLTLKAIKRKKTAKPAMAKKKPFVASTRKNTYIGMDTKWHSKTLLNRPPPFVTEILENKAKSLLSASGRNPVKKNGAALKKTTKLLVTPTKQPKRPHNKQRSPSFVDAVSSSDTAHSPRNHKLHEMAERTPLPDSESSSSDEAF